MKTQTQDQDVLSSGALARTTFGISTSRINQALIMRMLRSDIYTDKILAVLREYGSNAWDAHRMVGVHDRPIRVQLPTLFHPVLKIRDYGPGMSHEDVFTKFTQYGDSSKRDTNEEVGWFGVGCKSGFAYSTTFIVTSWHKGTKRVYTASIGKDEECAFTLDYEGDCEESETGMEIRIPVKSHDVYTFHKKAKYLFQYFDPFPDIVYGDEGKREHERYGRIVPSESEHKHGCSVPSGVHQWVAVMGCIPYLINMDELREGLETHDLMPFVEHQSGALFFPIGGIGFNAAREEVAYTEETCQAIINKLRLYRHELSESMGKDVKNAPDGRTRRSIVLRMQHLGIEPLKEHAHLAARVVRLHLPRDGSSVRNPRNLVPAPEDFVVRQVQSPGRLQTTEYASVVNPLTFYLANSSRSLRGVPLGYEDRVITPPHGRAFSPGDLDSIRKQVEAMLVGCEMDGYPIRNLSEVQRCSEDSGLLREAVNKRKYKADTFRLDNLTSSVLSNRWVIEDHEPSEDDVYFIINRFESVEGDSLYESVVMAGELAKFIGEEMPPIYGYKTTKRNPVHEDDVTGTPFRVWQAKLLERVYAKEPRLKSLALASKWVSTADIRFSYYRTSDSFEKWVETHLGPDHPVTFLARRHAWGHKLQQARYGLGSDLRRYIAKVQEDSRPSGYRCPAKQLLHKLNERYPLIVHGGYGWAVLNDRNHTHWFDYIKLIDKEHSDE